MVIRAQRFSSNQVKQVPGDVLGRDLHAKRVASLCDATLGVLHSASLAVCAIGQGLAAARGLNPKHATKQADRLLSNSKINVNDILARWVPHIVGARSSIVVALDWTDFDSDNQATIMLSLITDHGRATPLLWLTVDKRTLKDNRSLYEHRVLVRLAELLPADIKVCVVADRGFGDQKLYRMLNRMVTGELCFDYVHSLPRQHRRHRHDWRNPRRRRLGAGQRTRPRAARRGNHRRSLCGGNRGLRSGPRHEAGLVPGRQQHQRHGNAPDRILRPSLGNRVRTA